jgi:triosephosphate isomerase (TIM)
MRKKIVAGNWKMNLTAQEAQDLFKGIIALSPAAGVEIAVFPPSLYIDRLITGFPSAVKVGGQNAWHEDKGAFTGEVSMFQLRELGADSVLIGHSERRMHFGEDHELLRLKVNAAIANGLRPFFCCGEPRAIREVGQQESFVGRQLDESLFHLSEEDFRMSVIAYEPVWAIGTGLTATAEQAEDMHAYIRSRVADRYSSTAADETSILYGGSCNPSNAAALFACPNVDGGLIGGASLTLVDFRELVADKVWNI